jgi:Ca2+/Na+ antiporter
MTSTRSISGTAQLWAWALAAMIFLSVVVVSLIKGRLGQPGPDGDDVMRLVQIKDLLAGQGWFDLFQYRLGPQAGTPMHWSRIPDAPILILTALFDLFLPSEMALAWAITVWPPLSLLIVLAGLALAARHLGDGKLLVFTFIVALPVLFAHFRFLSGAIDHHNLQLGFLAVAVGASLDPLVAQRSMALSAVMLALSVAVGIELYPFVAVLCGFHALDWAIRGETVRRGTFAFGAMLAVAIAVCFFGTVPPSHWGRVYCDSLSIISFLALAIGGGGLVFCAMFLSGYSLRVRLAGLVAVGAACGGVFVFQGPQCLANPLDVLAPDVREIWFNSIIEARPMFAQESGSWPFIAYAMGTSLVGLAISVRGVIRGQDVRTHLMFALLLTLGLVLMLYQVRFYVFASLLAIVPCAMWVTQVYDAGRKEGGSRVAYLALLVLANPALWALPPTLLAPPEAKAEKAACLSEETLAALNSVPPGMILSDANVGALLLNQTAHSVMSANYHRDTAGIAASLKAFGLPPDEVPALLAENQVDYVLMCPGAAENMTFARLRPDGFLAHLSAGDEPEWLQPVAPVSPDVSSGRLYRFIPAN